MNIKNILHKNGLTVFAFARLLNISRPTLYGYIKDFESGRKISNEKYNLIFEELFKDDLSEIEFEVKLNKYRSLVQRDKAIGVIDLGMEKTDLFSTVMENVKTSFFSGNYDNDMYIFINMLISNYNNEKCFSHLVKYFMVLNGHISYDDVDFENESFLLYYFNLFDQDKKDEFVYKRELEGRFINRIEEIKKIKNQSNENLIKALNEELKKFNSIGVDLSEEEVLKILIKKMREE